MICHDNKVIAHDVTMIQPIYHSNILHLEASMCMDLLVTPQMTGKSMMRLGRNRYGQEKKDRSKSFN